MDGVVQQSGYRYLIWESNDSGHSYTRVVIRRVFPGEFRVTASDYWHGVRVKRWQATFPDCFNRDLLVRFGARKVAYWV